MAYGAGRIGGTLRSLRSGAGAALGCHPMTAWPAAAARGVRKPRGFRATDAPEEVTLAHAGCWWLTRVPQSSCFHGEIDKKPDMT